MTAPAYLLERGFAPETIARLGWRVEPLGADARRYGLPADAAGAVTWRIPYPARAGREAFERVRLVDAADLERYGGGKYRQPAGVPLDLYDPAGWLERDEPVDGLLLIEGEANAAAMMELQPGLPIVGLPGHNALTLELAQRIAHVPLVWLWLDRDEQGYERARQRVAEHLYAAGVGEVRESPRALPAGWDVADALRAEGREGAAKWIDSWQDYAAELERPAPLSAPDPDRYAGRRYDLPALIASADVEPPWRVEPIAADGHLTLLSAAGGEGKTWASLAFAGGVAHGATIAGLRCAEGRAVVFDAENGSYVLGSRLGTIEPGLPADRVAVYDAEGLRLNDARDRAWMLEVIRRERANLVVLDSLRALAPDAAENDSDDMAPIVNGAKTLARESGAAIVLLIHRGHGAERGHAPDFRGSTAIRDAADLLFVLERVPDDPERRWRRRLRCAKCRIASEPEDRWVGVRGWRDQVALTEAAPFERGAMEAEAARDDLEDRVAAFVAENAPASKRSVRDGVRGRNPDVDAALSRLEEAGRLRRTTHGWEACPDPSGTLGHAPAAVQGGGVPEPGERPVGPPAWGTPCTGGTVPVPDDGAHGDSGGTP